MIRRMRSVLEAYVVLGDVILMSYIGNMETKDIRPKAHGKDREGYRRAIAIPGHFLRGCRRLA